MAIVGQKIKKVYHQVNMMFGDIIKVTPSSKVVGDMTLYMVQNNLTEKDIYEKGDVLDFPQSVVESSKVVWAHHTKDSLKNFKKSS